MNIREKFARAIYDRRFGAGTWDRQKQAIKNWPSLSAQDALKDADAVLAALDWRDL
jgi:hypothetical protein